MKIEKGTSYKNDNERSGHNQYIRQYAIALVGKIKLIH